MTLRQSLINIAKIVADEASRNPEFRLKLEQAFGQAAASAGKPPLPPDGPRIGQQDGAQGTVEVKPVELSQAAASKGEAHKDDEKRRGGRRSPALLDPIALALEGEQVLRERLGSLDIERLHDVVAEYGMDPGKLVMKWRDRDRVIERVVEMSMGRATKGDAFRRE